MQQKFVHANSHFAILAKQIPDDSWDKIAAATPEWTFRQLVDHIIANNYAMATSLIEIEEQPTEDGVAILTTLHAATEAANQAAMGESDLSRVVQNQYGNDMSVNDVLKMGLADRSLHYWDLAVSLGVPADDFITTEDAGTVYEFIAPTAKNMREIKAFGPEIDVPLGASIKDRLLGLTGRMPLTHG